MFTMEINKLHWICDATDDSKDCCLHGNVTARIGSETFTDDCTVSATALYLLRSLTEDHIPHVPPHLNDQMLPCCGIPMSADPPYESVWLCGCCNGIDWTVQHLTYGVRLTTESGKQTYIDFPIYQETVFAFADAIQAYYEQCAPKEPFDEYDRTNYTAFWNEWNRRRGRAKADDRFCPACSKLLTAQSCEACRFTEQRFSSFCVYCLYSGHLTSPSTLAP